MRRTLLIVSYHHAPSPDVGAKRFSFLAREFVQLGYDVHVITNANGDSPHGHRADPTLPLAGRVHVCKSPLELPLPGSSPFRRKLNALIARLLAPVGLEYFWARAATRRALDVARGLPPGVVIATSPPHAALFAGKRIARRLAWPLIVDYRDPWSGYDWPAWRRGRFAQWVARCFESPIVARSSARVLNTPAMRVAFERHFPLARAHRNFVIPNGFDAQASAPPAPAHGPIEIVHAGSIFAGRSLTKVLEAARRATAARPQRPVRVVTLGELPAPERERIAAAGLSRFVEVRPRVPLTELRAQLARAHLLLVIVGEHMLYSTPYKVYDYMAAGRPILGVAPRDAALFDLLAESGAGTCVESDDVDGIVRAIESLADASIAAARVERFHWPALAARYALAIESVAGAAPDTTTRTAPAGRSVSARSR